jgi:acetylxylan esterase
MKPSQISFVIPVLTTASTAQDVKCPTGNGVGIIVARASTERPGPGIIGAIADDVVAQVPGSIITAVNYPATLQNYQSSEGQGVAEMTRLVQQFNINCAGSKMVLMGYSQVRWSVIGETCHPNGSFTTT